MKIIDNYNLKPLNTFNVESYCKHYIEIQDFEDLIDFGALKEIEFPNDEILVIGDGSNVLFTEDFNGIVVKYNGKGITIVDENEEDIIISAAAGETWDDLVVFSINHQCYGLENLSYIPGTVGAAPVQNIGAYGRELQEFFQELSAVDISTGVKRHFTLDDCRFSYRNSIFKENYSNQIIITNVVLKLSKKENYNLHYKDLKTQLQGKELNLNTIRKAIYDIRASKLPDPRSIGNAGSFFKNPVIRKDIFHQIKKVFPAITMHPVNEDSVKISAAWLIDQCGWKGKRIKDAGVYEKHSLIIVNHGNAKGADIYKLAGLIIEDVLKKFRIKLQPEVLIIH